MTAGAAATLHPFDEARVPELMRWFTDRESTRVWGGPESRFPFTPETFRADARLAELRTRMLVTDDGRLAAGSCSLFVVPSSTRAKALYERLGFSAMPTPEPAPELDPGIYLVTSDDGPRSG